MTIRLPEDLERSIHAEIHSGHFASADELVAQAVRSFLRRPTAPPGDPGLGSIGAMRDAAEELDEIVADAYGKRRADTWRDIDI